MQGTRISLDQFNMLQMMNIEFPRYLLPDLLAAYCHICHASSMLRSMYQNITKAVGNRFSSPSAMHFITHDGP